MKGVPSRIKKEKKVHELVIIGVYGLSPHEAYDQK
jgi:hypothetical protein